MLALPLVALFFFLLVFFTVLVVTMRRKALAYDPIARLPFETEVEDHDTRGRR